MKDSTVLQHKLCHAVPNKDIQETDRQFHPTKRKKDQDIKRTDRKFQTKLEHKIAGTDYPASHQWSEVIKCRALINQIGSTKITTQSSHQ